MRGFVETTESTNDLRIVFISNKIKLKLFSRHAHLQAAPFAISSWTLNKYLTTQRWSARGDDDNDDESIITDSHPHGDDYYYCILYSVVIITIITSIITANTTTSSVPSS